MPIRANKANECKFVAGNMTLAVSCIETHKLNQQLLFTATIKQQLMYGQQIQCPANVTKQQHNIMITQSSNLHMLAEKFLYGKYKDFLSL